MNLINIILTMNISEIIIIGIKFFYRFKSNNFAFRVKYKNILSRWCIKHYIFLTLLVSDHI